MKVLFLGIQGSGKGTQADLLSKEFNVIKISSGDLLREEKKKGTELGKEIARLIDKGNLVPDKIIHNLIKEKIEKKEDYILDGFPRNLEQAKLSEDFKIEGVIYINIPDEVVLDRLKGRLTCSKCNSIYHIKYNKPKIENKCNKCGSDLYVRKDETEEAIKKRIKEYKEKTIPLINYYKEKGILFEIDGDRSIEEIYGDIRKLFK